MPRILIRRQVVSVKNAISGIPFVRETFEILAEFVHKMSRRFFFFCSRPPVKSGDQRPLALLSI